MIKIVEFACLGAIKGTHTCKKGRQLTTIITLGHTQKHRLARESHNKAMYNCCQGYKRVIKVIQSLPVLYDFYYTVGKGSS